MDDKVTVKLCSIGKGCTIGRGFFSCPSTISAPCNLPYRHTLTPRPINTPFLHTLGAKTKLNNSPYYHSLPFHPRCENQVEQLCTDGPCSDW